VARRSAEGKFEREGELAGQLMRLKIDVIVTTGSTMTRAAKEATVTIPIVVAFDSDPMRQLDSESAEALSCWTRLGRREKESSLEPV
jgi:ABC-type uncharacterized transport system substrate-binding protein